ncbi:MAG: hypothetical protein KJN90_13535 [Gammaproteobacteria bacterium]|nr:hypothetical protein [Gammaproteobacteria bacterium]
MNWDAVGAVAELMGAIGVIGSLIYLATQVRTSNLASKVDSKLKMTEFLVNFQDLLLDSPELNDVMMRGRKGIENLTREEYLQYANMAQKAFWYFSAIHFQRRRNVIEEEDWYEVNAVVQYWTSARGTFEWWKRIGSKSFTGEFAAFIEQQFDFYGVRAPDTSQPESTAV